MSRNCSDHFDGYRLVYRDRDHQFYSATKSTRLPEGVPVVAVPYSQDWDPAALDDRHHPVREVLQKLEYIRGTETLGDEHAAALPPGSVVLANSGGQVRVIGGSPYPAPESEYPVSSPDELLGRVRSAVFIGAPTVDAALDAASGDVASARQVWDATSPSTALDDLVAGGAITAELRDVLDACRNNPAVVEWVEKVVTARGYTSDDERELWTAVRLGTPTAAVAAAVAAAPTMTFEPQELHPGRLEQRPDITCTTDAVSFVVHTGADRYTDEYWETVHEDGPTCLTDTATAQRLMHDANILTELAKAGHAVAEVLPSHPGGSYEPGVLFDVTGNVYEGEEDDEWVHWSDYDRGGDLEGYMPTSLRVETIPLAGVGDGEAVTFEHGCAYLVATEHPGHRRFADEGPKFSGLEFLGAFPSAEAARQALAGQIDASDPAPPPELLELTLQRGAVTLSADELAAARAASDREDVAMHGDPDAYYNPAYSGVAWEWVQKLPGRVLASGVGPSLSRGPDGTLVPDETPKQQTFVVTAVPVTAPAA